jgi:CRP-like cAMP-binding protein
MDAGEVMNRCFLFRNLDIDSARELYSCFEEKMYRIGEEIFSEGDIGDSLYVINEGEVKITTTDKDGNAQVVANLYEGDVIGEMALLTGRARAGKATFISNGRLLQLTKEKFENLKAGSARLHGAMTLNVATIVSQRLAAMTEKVSSLIDGLHSVEASQIDLEAELAKGKVGLLEFLGISKGGSARPVEIISSAPAPFGTRGGK